MKMKHPHPAPYNTHLPSCDARKEDYRNIQLFATRSQKCFLLMSEQHMCCSYVLNVAQRSKLSLPEVRVTNHIPSQLSIFV